MIASPRAKYCGTVHGLTGTAALETKAKALWPEDG